MMTDTLYGVGWFNLTPAQLAEIPEQYQAQAQGIRVFTGGAPVLFETIGEAQGFLAQIVKVNSPNNLKALTGVGAEALFLVKAAPRVGRANPWESPFLTRITAEAI